MARRNRGANDDSLKKLIINDFSGGLQLYKGALDLGINESPDMLNLIPFPGRVQYRGGWVPVGNFTDGADQAYPFYDANGVKHFVIWNGGNLEDLATGLPISIEIGAYTAGQKVGVVDSHGILYWSTKTVPIRFWNPALGTTGAVPQTGVSPVPASPFLFIYTGAIVAVGVKFGAFAYQPEVFAWSDINLFGSWDASNSQAVGPRNGATLEFGIVFGIAEIGVAPFRSFIIGRSDKGIYGYQGALGTLQEFLVNCPVGCIDGASAQYLPSLDKFGMIMFLGTDAQFWVTNGVTAQVVSLNVMPLLSVQVKLSFNSLTPPRFYSGYDEQRQYYFCSVGDIQYVFKWDIGAWSLFQGWPIGPTFLSPDENGIPSLFTASATAPGILGQCGIDQGFDNGVVPDVHYALPFLHMGDPEKLKEYDWVAIFVYETQTQYALDATSMPNCDGTFLTTKTLYFPPGNIPPAQAGIFTLDVSDLDGPDVLDGPGVGINVVGTGTPQVCHGRLSCPTVVTTGMLAGLQGLTQPLLGGAARIVISYNGGIIDFELVSVEVRFQERGYLRNGNQGINPESGVSNGFDPFVPGAT